MENYHSKERRLSNTVKPADMGLEEWQVALRQQQAQRERFTISELSPQFSPGEYQVRNPRTRSQYKVIYRGAYSPWNYCSCPDFRTSGLGTCKHVEAEREKNRIRKCQITRRFMSIIVASEASGYALARLIARS